MGYIFDALNKQRGEQPDPSGPDAENTQANEIQAEHEGTLASVMASANQDKPQGQADDDNTPFRLADIQLTINTDLNDQTVIGTTTGTTQAPPQQNAGKAAPVSLSIAADDTASAQADNDFEDVFDPDLDKDATPLKIAPAKPAPRVGIVQRLLGMHLRGRVDDRLIAMTNPASAMSEEYRSIRTSILARHDNERHLVHTITSATPQEGKTITCVNLGLSFAELRNRKTVIVECDLRLPTFAKLTNCDQDKPGLIDYLHGDAKLTEVVQQIEGSPLHIIPAGGRVSDEAVQLLSSGRMSRLIQALRTKYDHVIIDTPPVLQLADAGILGAQSEEVLVVARMRRTPRPLIEQAINTLASYNAQVNGIIATDNPRSRGRGYGYKYGYRYGYGYTYGYTAGDDRKARKRRDAA